MKEFSGLMEFTTFVWKNTKKTMFLFQYPLFMEWMGPGLINTYYMQSVFKIFLGDHCPPSGSRELGPVCTLHIDVLCVCVCQTCSVSDGVYPTRDE